ncbi:MAG: hypothetical protein KA339_02900 [Candidatus Kapabacteria bacterium]|nr:hypothetical protein [Ignavibacteria bacterium]MBP6509480.1 hypothetical protein [Candidatus Kapabacteria bacterium]MBK6418611.1 hypothetical protein [Ignavibacteria bacterium]MBK6760576.1 hypothetical protein [Ignavibacteria bacterium]MBK7411621.1 hypothetical protein [Ignavibacteria bacterium]
MQHLTALIIGLIVLAQPSLSQDGPQLPIVLQNADSIVGTGPMESGIREFLGNVRFTQGNVTVTCDRAIHNVALNRADLYGHVVVKQGSVTISAPYISYDGNTYQADATRGIKVVEGASTITSRVGRYSTQTHIMTFTDSVAAVDDSVRIWADTLTYDRDADTSVAHGRVVVSDSSGSAWLTGDHAYRNAVTQRIRMCGNAAAWQWDPGGPDTVYVAADTLLMTKDKGLNRYEAVSAVQLVRGAVSARADTMVYVTDPGRIDLLGHPILWSDSMLIVADTIIADVPDKTLRSVVGLTKAILVSRTDTLYPDRFDQIGGDVVLLSIDHDTVRQLSAIGNAQSITFRTEEKRPEGLAKAAADTIRANFEHGQLSDVYWLGGIEGEHHPEPVVAGRAESYRLPGFVWRDDRPVMARPVQPFTKKTVVTGKP